MDLPNNHNTDKTHVESSDNEIAKQILISLGCFLLSLSITFGLWKYSLDQTIRENEKHFNIETETIRDRITNRINLYSDILYSIKGLYAVHGHVSSSEWQVFTKNALQYDKHPGLSTIAYIEIVDEKDISRFEKEIQTDKNLIQDVYKNFQVKPKIQNSEKTHYIVKYIEPINTKESAIGLDLSADPIRKETIERALAMSNLVTSPTVELAAAKEKGFLMLMPIYEASPSHTNITNKGNNKIVAFAQAALITEKLFDRIDYSDNKKIPIDFEIYNGQTIDKDSLLYDSNKNLETTNINKNKNFNKTMLTNVGGHTWTIYYSSEKISKEQNNLPMFILIGGIIMSLLIFGLIYLLTTSRARSLRLVKSITNILQKNEEQYRHMAENASDMIYKYQLTPEEKYVYVNPAAEKLTGYKPQNYYDDPKLWSKLIYPEDKQKLLELQNSTAPILIRLNTKDKQTKWVELQSSSIKNDVGEIIAIEGIARDVTLRQTAEQELKERTEELEKLNKMMINREIKILELKKENESLKKQTNT